MGANKSIHPDLAAWNDAVATWRRMYSRRPLGAGYVEPMVYFPLRLPVVWHFGRWIKSQEGVKP